MDKTALRVAARFLQKTARDNKFVGQDCRLTWSRNHWLLEELPQKGKRKLRVAEMQNLFGSLSMRRSPGVDNLMAENILQDAKLATSDGYDAIKKKLETAMREAIDTFVGLNASKDLDWVKKTGALWYENDVYFLEVAPEDTDPMTVEGKDFTLVSQWTRFEAASPDSDFQQIDPHYTQIVQKSPGAARKLYNTLKTEPTALKNISWANLGKWLDTKKIGFKMYSSQW